MNIKEYTTRKFRKLLKRNGYEYVRCNGDHFIYRKGESTIVINKDLNRAVAKRLIKQYELKEEK